MKGSTHLLLGIAGGVAVAATAPMSLSLASQQSHVVVKAALICIAALASLLPDIDHPKSILSGYAIGIGGAIRLLASHRTWTHSILFAVLIGALVWVATAHEAGPYPLMAYVMGIGSHLIADMLTVAGVPLFLPLARRSFRLAPYPVLKMTSWLLEATATVGAVAVIGFILWEGL
jgi:inner membrane protein